MERPRPFTVSWLFEGQGFEKNEPILMTPLFPFFLPSVPVAEDLLG